MQRLLLGFLILLVASGGAYAWSVCRSDTPSSSSVAGRDSADDAFAWGVYTNAYALSDHYDDPFRPEGVAEQVAVLKQLGVRYVRTSYEWTLPEGELDAVNDAWLNGLTEAGFRPLLVLDIPLKTYENAYNRGYAIAKRYPAITHFQLLNELSGIVKPGRSGLAEDDYREAEYPQLLAVVRGLSEGIHAANPNAQRVVSANWLGVGIIDRLIRDGVAFEIVGWNWFSDMGADPAHPRTEGGAAIDIPAHFVAQGKRFWVVEANRHGGSVGAPAGVAEQATYLEGFARRAYANPNISGFFVFKLTNGQDAGSREMAWGIVDTKSVPDGATQTADGRTVGFGELKPAGRAYQSVIEQTARGGLKRPAK
ncbi:MAG: hypothetical protein ACOYBJ_01950 [Patescibacteria group bacterium]|jgi:hypothetical protein